MVDKESPSTATHQGMTMLSQQPGFKDLIVCAAVALVLFTGCALLADPGGVCCNGEDPTTCSGCRPLPPGTDVFLEAGTGAWAHHGTNMRYYCVEYPNPLTCNEEERSCGQISGMITVYSNSSCTFVSGTYNGTLSLPDEKQCDYDSCD